MDSNFFSINIQLCNLFKLFLLVSEGSDNYENETLEVFLIPTHVSREGHC